MTIYFNNAQQGLSELIKSLWEMAQGLQPKTNFPIRIIDDPIIVREIFNKPDIFKKNYSFLESLSHGRFTENGEGWSARTSMTQEHYSKNTYLKETELIKNSYRKYFHQSDINSLSSIGAASLEAAVEIISKTFGASKTISWKSPWLERVRTFLVERQWVGFCGTTPARFIQLEEELQKLRMECKQEWSSDDDVQKILSRFSTRGQHIENFDAAEELIQNIIAASETTATTVMWAAVILASRPDIVVDIKSGKITTDMFVMELLRVYPPVPFVTRVATQDIQLQDIQLQNINIQKNEPLLVSIFGMHYSSFWEQPTAFSPERFSNPPLGLRDNYMPFLIGPRACGGRKLAELELRAAVDILVNEYQLNCKSPGKVTFEYGLSFRPNSADFMATKIA